ncbi:tetratricopeptide repeat protein [Prosthecobacter dejongeii]|nr:tetratricopeptide repeat protein [Prosthecobacter dejongeii]
MLKWAVMGLLLIQNAFGCLWDKDTLDAERARFPGIGVLISGSFARHSKEFHQWRIQQREKDIASDQSLPIHLDDLAVSQHKLGDHQAAIQTMLRKDKLIPGLYETYSNLGTFYIYTGDLKEALRYIDKALAINANAHFGREKYQKWLVEWILETRATPPEPEGPSEIGYGGIPGFASFVARMEAGGMPASRTQSLTLSTKQRADAIRGVTGMIFFADYDNPLLQEALGDLLIAGDIRDNAANLASLCYMHAALKAPNETEKARLMKKCELSGRVSYGFDLKKVETSLKTALKKGAEYQESVRQDEVKWIAEGHDASAEFQKKYLVPSSPEVK